MMQFTLHDSSTVTLPDTLIIDSLVTKANYSLERAPYSDSIVIAGDGLPVAEPLTIRGKAYFSTSTAADAWLVSIKASIDNVASITVDTETINLLAADLVAVPTGFPRILSVNIKLYPAQVQ